MHAYWLKFTDGTHACCQGESAYDAKIIAEKVTGKTVAGEQFKPDAQSLPYPASPSVWRYEHPVHGITPDFCLHGDKCAGKTSCPRSYSCVE